MKKMFGISFIFLSVIIFFTGCDEVETTTKVHKDGSCTRSVVLDSSDVEKSPYPLPVSAGWDIQYTKSENNHVMYNASRHFKSIEALAHDLEKSAGNGSKISIMPKLEKRFRWFYTYYRYSEDYNNISSRFLITKEEYFTPEEIKLLSNSSDSTKTDKKLDDKFDEWITSNFFESFYRQLRQVVEDLGDPDFSPGLLESKKEALYQVFYKDELISLDDEQTTLTDKDMVILSETLGTRVVYQIRNELDHIIAGLMRELEWLAAVQLTDFNQIVVMPGLIIDTNAKTIEGSKLTWDVDNSVLFFSDYQMWVESRVVNRGVIVGTLLFVLLLGTMLIISVKRQRI